MTKRILNEPKRLELMSKLAFAPKPQHASSFKRYRETLDYLNELLRSGGDERLVIDTLKATKEAYAIGAEVAPHSIEVRAVLDDAVATLETIYREVLERWTQASRLKDAIDELYIPLSRARQELPHTARGNENAVKLHEAMKTADELTRLGWPPLEEIEKLIDLVNEVVESPDCDSVELAPAVNRVEAELVREIIAQTVS